MTNLKERIEREVEKKAFNKGIMGDEMVTIKMKLTDEEKNEFLNEVTLDSRYGYEIDGNELYVTYIETAKES